MCRWRALVSLALCCVACVMQIDACAFQCVSRSLHMESPASPQRSVCVSFFAHGSPQRSVYLVLCTWKPQQAHSARVLASAHATQCAHICRHSCCMLCSTQTHPKVSLSNLLSPHSSCTLPPLGTDSCLPPAMQDAVVGVVREGLGLLGKLLHHHPPLFGVLFSKPRAGVWRGQAGCV